MAIFKRKTGKMAVKSRLLSLPVGTTTPHDINWPQKLASSGEDACQQLRIRLNLAVPPTGTRKQRRG